MAQYKLTQSTEKGLTIIFIIMAIIFFIGALRAGNSPPEDRFVIQYPVKKTLFEKFSYYLAGRPVNDGGYNGGDVFEPFLPGALNYNCQTATACSFLYPGLSNGRVPDLALKPDALLFINKTSIGDSFCKVCIHPN